MPARNRLALRLLAIVAIVTLAVPAVDAASRSGNSAGELAARGRTAAPVWEAPAIDPDRLAREDRDAAVDPRRPFRVGLPQTIGLTPADAGRWRHDERGTRWQFAVRSTGARWTTLTIEGVELPHGASLIARDGSGGELARLIGETRRDSWRTPPARGELVELELLLTPGTPVDRVALQLETVTHGYRGLFERADETAGSRAVAGGGAGECNVDVECALGDELADESRGIVKLLINAGGAGTYLCSGTLINTTANDCRPYVLTANHCYNEGGGAATTTFIFGYELPACGGGSSDELRFISGATELATWAESDFKLMEMSIDPPDAWEPYFNGWNRTTLVPTNAWVVHHPSGDVKKISRDAGPLTNGVVELDHWRVNNWEDGTTEGGSSGAPLFDQNRLVVGQLDFGTASCSSPSGWDEFGKLAVSWGGGATPNERLSNWLDPLGTAPMSIGGLDYSACAAGTFPTLAGETVDDRLGNEDGLLHPGEIARLELSLANRGITAATAVSAVLGSGDPRVVIRESDAAWPTLPGLNDGLASIDPHFELELEPDFPCGANVPLTLAIAAAEGDWSESFTLSTGTTSGTSDSFLDDLEGTTTGWSEETLLAGRFNPWATSTVDSHSPTTSWFVPDLPARHDTVLIMPTQDPLPPGAALRFWHRMDSDNGFDGGVLELSLDGASWFDAAPWFTGTGYNGGISEGFNSTLAGRDAWTGLIDWQQVEVDLASFEGAALSVRWRFALDNFTGGVGWFVDDVQIEVDERVCPSPWVNIQPGAHCSGALTPRNPSRPGPCSATKPRLRVRP